MLARSRLALLAGRRAGLRGDGATRRAEAGMFARSKLALSAGTPDGLRGDGAVHRAERRRGGTPGRTAAGTPTGPNFGQVLDYLQRLWKKPSSY